MKNIALTFLTWLVLIPNLAHSEIAATPLPGDTRLVVFSYDQHNTYHILARPKSVTDIQFSSEERIKALALGDTIQWEVAKTTDGQHLFIKPKAERIQTSATIITDKRSYQLLLSSGSIDGKWYQRVTWEYPDLILLDETKKAEAADRESAEQSRLSSQVVSSGMPLDTVNFSYNIDGEAPFKPVGVMDDGKFTFIRMPQQIQELPALFLIDADRDAELINYVVRGDYLVVQRLFERVLLKIGKQEVRVTNAKLAKSRGGLFGLFKGD